MKYNKKQLKQLIEDDWPNSNIRKEWFEIYMSSDIDVKYDEWLMDNIQVYASGPLTVMEKDLLRISLMRAL